MTIGWIDMGDLNKSNNLAIFINSLNKGGAERVVSILANDLILDSNITLILLNNDIKYPIDKRIKIEVLFQSVVSWLRIINFFLAPLILYRVLKSNKINTLLVFLYKPAFLSVFTRLFFCWKGIIIISERTYTLSHYNPQTIKGKIGLFLIQFFYNRANLILPNSKLTADSLRRNINVSTPLRVIYNPIVLPGKTILKYPFDKKTVDILSVGNFHNYKNHEMLLLAMSNLKFYDWHLNMVGDGPMKSWLLELVDKLNIKDNVSFLGNVDAYLFYPKADVFILTSFIEGFPNSLVEAMAHGLPVISTDCKSGPREILCPNTDYKEQLDINSKPEYGEYGILVPVNNHEALSEAFHTLFSDHQLIHFYQSQSILRANDFSHNNILNQFKLTINDIFLGRN